eukprot:350073-Chlamydomonas_euryale.AAC.6
MVHVGCGGEGKVGMTTGTPLQTGGVAGSWLCFHRRRLCAQECMRTCTQHAQHTAVWEARQHAHARARAYVRDASCMGEETSLGHVLACMHARRTHGHAPACAVCRAHARTEVPSASHHTAHSDEHPSVNKPSVDKPAACPSQPQSACLHWATASRATTTWR